MNINNYPNILNKAIAALETAPEGSLIICKNHGVVQFYHRTEGKKEYISKKNILLAKALAQKKYNQLVEKALTAQVEILPRINDRILIEIYNSMPEEIKGLIDPYEIRFDQAAEKWQSEQYIARRIDRAEISYKTEKGGYVRSKSELIIANKLFAERIPYRYEAKLTLKDNIVIYPDFTILKPNTQEIILWEHFGMMDNPKYLDNFIIKINTYAENGYLLGKNLICSFESSSNPVNIEYIERQIKAIKQE